VSTTSPYNRAGKDLSARVATRVTATEGAAITQLVDKQLARLS
jgi:hypothetical protein